MTEPWQQTDPPMAPEQAVGKAIQELTAARLGRGFVPLGRLLVAGAWQHLQEGAVAEAFAEGVRTLRQALDGRCGAR